MRKTDIRTRLWSHCCRRCQEKFQSSELLAKICPACQQRKQQATSNVTSKIIGHPDAGWAVFAGIVAPKVTDAIFNGLVEGEFKRLEQEDKQEKVAKKKLEEEEKRKAAEKLKAEKEAKAAAEKQKQAQPKSTPPPIIRDPLPQNVAQACNKLGIKKRPLTPELLKRHYNERSFKEHPDRNGGTQEAHKKMLELNKAKNEIEAYLSLKK